jgi:hypothetical protein
MDVSLRGYASVSQCSERATSHVPFALLSESKSPIQGVTIFSFVPCHQLRLGYLFRFSAVVNGEPVLVSRLKSKFVQQRSYTK